MTGQNWFVLIFFLTVLTLLTKPLGIYVYKVLEPKEKTPLDFLFKRLENWTYRLIRLDTEKEHTWVHYSISVTLLTLVSALITFFFLMFQEHLPLNPEHAGHIPASLNANITVSYLTNTNLNCYPAETALSYFSQMVPLVFQNFLSPAVGLAVAAAFIRGIARYSKKTLGNFWVDIIRITYYLLIPLAILLSLVFISEGIPQNFKAPVTAHTLESHAPQTIIQGPIASREAIKILGTNGGGYTNANAAHPYENPTPFSNFLQALCILLIPAAQTYYLGKKTKNQRHGWCLYFAMLFVFALGVIFSTHFEEKENPHFSPLNLEKNCGNQEGKEVRFHTFGSTLYVIATTATSNGATNAQCDSFTPLGGLFPLLNLQLGEVIFGGVGSGLYNMLLFVIFGVFAVGLIIGKTPEYLGNKFTAFDMKMVMIALVAYILNILGFTAWACVSNWGIQGLGNEGPHGLSEILFIFSSAAGNNGSAFAGLDMSSNWYLWTLTASMLLGRFVTIIPILALAGSFAHKKRTPPSLDSFPVSGFAFVALLVMTIILIGALSFLPSLVMGPLMEHFYLHDLKLF